MSTRPSYRPTIGHLSDVKSKGGRGGGGKINGFSFVGSASRISRFYHSSCRPRPKRHLAVGLGPIHCVRPIYLYNTIMR